MKKLLFSCIFMVISFGLMSANWVGISSQVPAPAKIRLVSSTLEKSKVQFTIEGFQLTEVTTPRGKSFTLSVAEGIPLQETGAPDVLKLTAALAIPDMAGMEVHVISSSYTDYPNIDLAPSKGVISRNIDPSTVPYTYGKSYQRNAFFPGTLADAGTPYIIRDVRGQNLVLYPFQYNPVTKTLRVYQEVTVELRKVNDLGMNPLGRKVLNHRETSEFSAVYHRHFLNADNLDYTALNDYGKVLVICYGAFMDAMTPYVNWKNALGFPTKIVNVTTIGTTAAAIKSYITSYYNNNGLAFVLLVGDAAQIPTNNGGGLGGPSDNAYGYVVGNDHYSDIFIGRFSAENVGQVQTQVERTIYYEQSPSNLTDDWYTTAIGIASDQGPGDDNEYDYQHIRNQQTKLLAYTYTMNPELFDGSQGGNDAAGNPNPSLVSTAVNNGGSIILYTGHGSTTSWGTSGFSNTNVNALTNQGKLPFIWSVACVNGEFMNGTCFAEAWMRASQGGLPTGAIGFLGATINQSWNSPMAGQDEMTDILVESFPSNIKRTFAGLSINGCMKMIDQYGTDGSNMADTWTVFGDPTLYVRTATPVVMTVTHPATLFSGSTSLTATCNINGARATATLNDSILATGLVAGNSVTLTFPGLSAPGDSVHLVVSAFNKIPYIADIPIITPSGPYMTYMTNHVNDTTGNNDHMADFGEEILMTLYMKNVGIAATENLTVKLRTQDAFVTLNDTVESYGVMAPAEIKSVVDGFKFTVHNNIPDGHAINFTLVSQDGANTWNSTFTVNGHAPVLAAGNVIVIDSTGNNNGRLDPGETAFLKIFIENGGSSEATGILAHLVAVNPFVTVVSDPLSYGTLAGGNNGWRLFEIAVDALAPQGQTASFMLQITADKNLATASDFNLVIGRIPALVIDLDGNANSGTVMKSSIEALDLMATYVAGSVPSDLANYSSVFVSLGTYPDNRALTNSEGQLLATYLTDGGRLYMEGGDTWAYDPPTPVHSMFNITASGDGASDLDQLLGVSGTFTAGMGFAFSGDNGYIDHIVPGTGAMTVLTNSNPVYNTTIANDATIYRTIAASSEFGGLDDGTYPSTKMQLMKEYLTFFGIQPPPLAANFFAFPTSIEMGETVTFSDFSTGGVTTWNWSFPGGVPATSTDQNPVITYPAGGLYDVELTVSNGVTNNTLVRTGYVWVNFPVGTGDKKVLGCTVYPNPGNGEFHLNLTSPEDQVTLTVYNMVGATIYNERVNVTGNVLTMVIHLENQPAGVYFLSTIGNNSTLMQKLIISK